ncbi:DinB family protein [Telluribacter sp.]|jgi:hypothetical protein|uniref:DinB family protein n=1 Tax=Telluribacter sp. TaxID=1978767 RepID=UPI002E0F7C4C|nr:DinB family protein [Telluribacter sp.]
MNKSTINPMPVFFDRYINRVEEMALLEALQRYAPDIVFAETDLLTTLGDKIYAPGKWTVKEILQHCLDTERIMTYRALRFARNDKTQLPGFEEDYFAAHAKADRRTLPDLLEEWALLRTSTLALFRSFDEEMLMRKGLTFKGDISVLALGFVICGHPVHHYSVIEERYYPLLDSKPATT